MKTSENKAPIPGALKTISPDEPIYMNGELIAKRGSVPRTGGEVTLDGITKTVTTLDELNELFAILLTSGSAPFTSAEATSYRSKTMI